MSGHSKWSNIKNKKGALDAKRGKLFSQLAKNIRVAVKEGGNGDPNQNAALRLAVEKAKAANMPGENVKRAIERGLGVSKGGVLEEVVYEGYGPHGVGFLVIAITDNKTRTASEVRAAFTKAGGSLGGPGSAMYLFHKEGTEYKVSIPFPLPEESQKEDIEKLEEALVEQDDIEEVFHNATWEEQV